MTGMSSVDALESDHPYFVGRSGGTGTRPGNFALQNSDVLLSIGNRQGFAQTGFQYQDWARESYTILNDIDENELKKPNLHVSLPVVGDAGELIRGLLAEAKKRGADKEYPLFKGEDWRKQCLLWKKKYPVVTEKHYETLEEGCTNIYAFYGELSKAMKENETLMVSVELPEWQEVRRSRSKKDSALSQIQTQLRWDSAFRRQQELQSHSQAKLLSV